jgi:putative membrane protein
MWRYGDHMTGWGWGVMAIFMLLLLATVITAVVLIVQATGRERGRDREPGPSATPEQVLAHRFARGEIDLLEYQSRLDGLHGRSTPQPPGAR